jgi:hypothetical protein
MKKNVFKYLRKKIFEHSTITERVQDSYLFYKIECLGFEQEMVMPVEYPAMEFAKGQLIDRLVQEPGFLQKLEQIENRKMNLKSLLD